MGQSELILNEIYDIWYTPWWQISYGYGIILVLGLVGLIFCGVCVYWFKKRSLTPQQKAIKELRALTLRAITDHKSIQQIYAEMTASLKKYIAARYRSSLHGSTDYECIILLKKLLGQDSLIVPIENLMRTAQEVKFARTMVLVKQIKEDIAGAMLFIERTSVQEQNR
jgi:hypothetical protein